MVTGQTGPRHGPRFPQRHEAPGRTRRRVWKAPWTPSHRSEIIAGMSNTCSCSFPNCGKPAKARGYCYGHYRQLRAGEPLRPLRIWTSNNGDCSFNGCQRRRAGRGLCAGHLAQLYEGRPMQPLRGARGKCSFPDCSRPHYAKGHCITHYWQQKSGRPLRPIRSQNGRSRNRWGYILVRAPDHPNAGKNGYVLEHVMVMAEILGRPLLLFEEVHHRNGVRDDNRPSNLELWSTSQPPGQRVEDKIAWAVELLQQYAPELLRKGVGRPRVQGGPPASARRHPSRPRDDLGSLGNGPAGGSLRAERV